jgi:hypothetical protein
LGLLRRTSKGRHALGTAVTSIPSAPPAAPVPARLPAETLPPVAPAAEPPLRTSIAELIATGEAWRSHVPELPPLADPPAVAAAAPPLPAAVAVARPTRFDARVQLGFRDGSTTTLDADSEQALALALLAQSLTRRD